MGQPPANVLDRRAVVAELLLQRDGLLVVSGLGGTTWDVASVGDDDLNFYLWGGMGNAVPLALGLAIARPTCPVLVITGDGEMLMGLGALATVALQRPPNLAIAVIDNGRYGETGGQATHTAGATDLAAVARAAGIAQADTITTMPGVRAWRERVHGRGGPLFAAIKVGAAGAGMVLPPRDGVWLKHRFRQALAARMAD